MTKEEAIDKELSKEKQKQKEMLEKIAKDMNDRIKNRNTMHFYDRKTDFEIVIDKEKDKIKSIDDIVEKLKDETLMKYKMGLDSQIHEARHSCVENLMHDMIQRNIKVRVLPDSYYEGFMVKYTKLRYLPDKIQDAINTLCTIEDTKDFGRSREKVESFVNHFLLDYSNASVLEAIGLYEDVEIAKSGLREHIALFCKHKQKKLDFLYTVLSNRIVCINTEKRTPKMTLADHKRLDKVVS
jgi:hypothetical protein